MPQENNNEIDKDLRQIVYNSMYGNNNLNEMYGLGDLVNRNPVYTDRNDELQSGYNRNNYTSNINTKMDELKQQDYEKRYIRPSVLDQFQIQAKERLLNKQDTFLSIPPSRGKTDPIIGGFRILFKRHLLRRNINYTPSLLYIVPRKQLAGQITTKDVLDDIVIPLLYPLDSSKALPEEKAENLDTSHLFPEYRRMVTDLRNAQNNNNTGDIRRLESNMRTYELRLADSLTAEIVGGGNSSIKYIDYNRTGINFSVTPIIVATYEKAVNFLNSGISHIVIDEVQELLPHPGETYIDKDMYNKSGTIGKLGKYQSLTNVLKNAPRNSSITLMTGSVNAISVNQIAEYFNKHYARSFEVIPKFDANMPALNRSNLSVQPLQSMSGHNEQSIKNRINLCKKIIVENQTNSLMIIFSNSTSGQGIFRIIQDVVKMLPPKNPNFLKSNTKNLDDVKPDGWTRTINEFDYLKYFNIKDIFTSGPDSKNSMTEPDESNILYQAVLRGIAPLNGKMDQVHKRTIQKLFIAKQIPMMLATDALGVGANVQVQYLYIPSASKFDGSKLAKVDESSLTQLIHRAGRNSSKFPVATIYCSIEDFDYINHLVFNDPRSVVPQINPYLLQDLQDLEKHNGASFIRKLIAGALFT